MKDILQEVLALEHEIDDNNNWVCSNEDMINITRFIVNKTLETQALTLNGLANNHDFLNKNATDAYHAGESEGKFTLQQAADHLRAQKIENDSKYTWNKEIEELATKVGKDLAGEVY